MSTTGDSVKAIPDPTKSSRSSRPSVSLASGLSSGLVLYPVSSMRSLMKTRADHAVRDFDWTDAKTWFPVSFLLVAVIYTGSKSLVSKLSTGEEKRNA